MARQRSTSKSDSSAMKALGAARAAELAAQADPAAEARHHEELFLKGLGAAQREFDWLVEHRAWKDLGHASVADWWAQRVRPVMVGLEARPTAEMAEKLLAIVQEDERALPAAQRRKKAELAELVLVGEWTARGRKETRQRRTAAGSDLEDSSSGGGSDTGRGQNPPVDEGSAGDGGAGPLTGTATQDPPAAADSAEAEKDAHSVPRALVADEDPSVQQPGSNSSSDDAEPSTPPEEPGDRYKTDEGDKPGEAADPPAASPDLVHTDHPHRVAGEAPADDSASSASGAGNPSDEGGASGDETAEDSPPGSSAVDPDQPIATPEELKKLIDEWLDVLDRRVEYGLLAPQYTEDSLLDLELQLEGFARTAGLMRRWWEEETGRSA